MFVVAKRQHRTHVLTPSPKIYLPDSAFQLPHLVSNLKSADLLLVSVIPIGSPIGPHVLFCICFAHHHWDALMSDAA